MTATTLESPTSSPAKAPRNSSALRTSSVFIERSLRHSLRDGEGLVMAMALPVMLMVLFTQVFGGAIDGGKGQYTNYLVPGIILLCAGFGAASVAVSVSRDMTTGAVSRFRTLPIGAWTVLVGHAVASLIRNLLATAVVLAVGVALGFRPSAGPMDWLIAITHICLYIAAISLLFAFVGLLAGSPEAANGYGFVLLFLPYVSSGFVPVDTMPGWLQPFAQHQPVTVVIETVRAHLTGGTGGQPVASLLWSGGIAIASVILIGWRFSRSTTR